MLKIKASVKPSNIEGLGLFAGQKIPKGTVVWQFNPRFDLLFDAQEVKAMPEQQREFIIRYAPFSTSSQKYVYSIDDSRFTNHSSIKNNLDTIEAEGEPEEITVANRDIEEGEEILVNYREFDVNDEHSQEEYLNT